MWSPLFSQLTGNYSLQESDWLGAIASSCRERILPTDVSLPKLFGHNSKFTVQSNLAIQILEVKTKQNKTPYCKRKMPRGVSRRVKWSKSENCRLGGERYHQERSLCKAISFFSSRNPVIKSPSSIGNYKSSLDSCILYIFYIAREEEKFPLSKIFLLSTLKGFCW